MPRKRRFSEEPFGATIERLMDETGVTYRGLAAKTDLSAGYLQPPRPRQPARALERRDRATGAARSASRPSTSASTGCA